MSARSFVQRDMSSMAERNLSNGHENDGDGLGDCWMEGSELYLGAFFVACGCKEHCAKSIGYLNLQEAFS